MISLILEEKYPNVEPNQGDKSNRVTESKLISADLVPPK